MACPRGAERDVWHCGTSKSSRPVTIDSAVAGGDSNHPEEDTEDDFAAAGTAEASDPMQTAVLQLT